MENRTKLLIGSVFIVVLLLVLSPFADPNPDGLESAAGEGKSEGSAFDLGFLTDYGSEDSLIHQLIQNDMIATIVSGLIGIMVVVGIFSLPLIFLRLKKEQFSNDR